MDDGGWEQIDTYSSVSLLIIFKSILSVNKLFYQQIVTTQDQKDS